MDIVWLPVKALGGAIISLLAISCSICVYRLWFHPYAKYPGPFLAKLTSWYAVYHTYTGDHHIDIWRCHEKYGDIVRYAPNRLLINTEMGLKSIYSFGSNTQKSAAYHRISLVKGVEASQSVVNREVHTKLRRIVSQGFSESFLQSYSEEMSKVIELFMKRLGMVEDDFADTQPSPHNDGWTCSKNMARYSDFFTFDVMCRLVFGRSYGMLETKENHWIPHAIEGQLRRISFLQSMPELEDLGLHRLLFPEARRRAFEFSAKSKEMLDERTTRQRNHKSGPDDIFSVLLAARDQVTGEKLSEHQLWAESNLLIVAGSDTSSTGLAAALFYLSRNPHAYARVTKELRDTFSSYSDVISGQKLSSCSYLRSVITEAMRLCPPAPGAMWREVLPGGISLGNMHIPEGYDVGTGIYALHHNPHNFPEPFKYKPERWLAEEVGQNAVDRAARAYTAFSIGPRNCVGKSLALREITLALAAILVEYDFRIAPGKEGDVGEGKGKFKDQYQTFWAFTSLKDGPYLEFKKVKS